MQHRPVRLVLSALAAATLFLGACGGEDESSPAVSGVDFPTDAPEPPAGEAGGSDDHGSESDSGSDSGGGAEATTGG